MTPAAPSPEMDNESEAATLRLLRSCVEAMGLLQGTVEGLDSQVREQLEAAAKDSAALRSEVATLKTCLGEATSRLNEAEHRIARLEVGAQDFAMRHADDVAAARTEAANWRMRVETDAMAFDQLSARLTHIEQGLSAKLEEATQSLAEREAENARLQAETRIVESASERLRTRLVSVDATIADQRARIACLQNKLATATYAIRFEHMSRAMEGGSPEGDGQDILDLTTLASKSLISAA